VALAWSLAGQSCASPLFLRRARPTVLTVAVGTADFDDAALISAFARKFVAGGSPVRLFDRAGPSDAFERLKKAEAQLAVVRSDGNGSYLVANRNVSADAITALTQTASTNECG
jgi:hypothetical protein